MPDGENRLQQHVREIERTRAETHASRAVFFAIVLDGFGHRWRAEPANADEFKAAKAIGLFNEKNEVRWDSPRLHALRTAVDAFTAFQNSLTYDEIEHLKIDTSELSFWKAHGDF